MARERLTETEQAAWGGLLCAHAELWRELEDRLVPSGLNMNEYSVLVALEAAGSCGVRMSDLAARSRMSSGGFTRLADRLQSQRLIDRQRCETDGRGYFAVITEDGCERLEQARSGHLEDVRELFLDKVKPVELDAMAAAFARVLGADNPAAKCEASEAKSPA